MWGLQQCPASFSHGLANKRACFWHPNEYMPRSLWPGEMITHWKVIAPAGPLCQSQVLTIKTLSICQETGKERREGKIVHLSSFTWADFLLVVQYQFEGQSLWEDSRKKVHICNGKERGREKLLLMCYIPLLIQQIRDCRSTGETVL